MMYLVFILIVHTVLFSCSNRTESYTQEVRLYLETVDFEEEKENYSLDFIETYIKPNQGLFQILIDLEISSYIALQIINVLRFNVDLKKLKPLQKIRVKINKFREVLSFQYQENIALTHEIIKDPFGSFHYYKKQLPLTKKYRFIEGFLKENTSLNNELIKKNVQLSLVAVINNLISSKVNMRYKSRPGDHYKILVEDFWYQDQWIFGAVLFVEYQGKKVKIEKFFRYFDYNEESSYNSYYSSNGQSLFTKGLRFPVKKFRVSSHYGIRIHPVTGRRKKHHGIDYVAPLNSKVHAVAKGVVIISTYDQYSGNYIAILHKDQSVSYYLHLHQRFIQTGKIVKNNEIIGTVGQTGLVTGTHLHFGFKNSKGHWINPASKKMIATPKLTSNRLIQFKKQIKDIQKVVEIFLKKQDTL